MLPLHFCLTLFSCLLFLLPTSCGAMQANFISDTHYDPLYGKPGGYGPCQGGNVPLGEPGCDSPTELVASICGDMQAQASSYTFLAGDLQRHRFSFVNNTLEETIGFLSEKLAAVTPDSTGSGTPKVVVAVGNNDMVPNYSLDITVNPSPILQEEAKIMQRHGILSAEEGKRFQRCGYYRRDVSSKLRVIVLNTLVWCFSIHPPIPDTEEDPCGQFQFLSTELEYAREAHSNVIIMSHIPPYINTWGVLQQKKHESVSKDMYWKPMYQKRFNRLMKDYKDTVSVQIYGHTHFFSFQALTGGVPSFIIPALTPIFRNIPSYFIAQLDEEDFTLKSLTQRYLSNATWVNGMRVEDVFGDLTDVESLKRKAIALLTSDILWSKYVTLRAGGAENTSLFPGGDCDVWCRKVVVCSMVFETWDEITSCTKITKEARVNVLFLAVVLPLAVIALLGIVIFFMCRDKPAVTESSTEMRGNEGQLAGTVDASSREIPPVVIWGNAVY